MAWIKADKAPCDDVTEMLAICDCEPPTYWLVKRDAQGAFWYDDGEGKTFVTCVTHVSRLPDPPTAEDDEDGRECVSAQSVSRTYWRKRMRTDGTTKEER